MLTVNDYNSQNSLLLEHNGNCETSNPEDITPGCPLTTAAREVDF